MMWAGGRVAGHFAYTHARTRVRTLICSRARAHIGARVGGARPPGRPASRCHRPRALGLWLLRNGHGVAPYGTPHSTVENRLAMARQSPLARFDGRGCPASRVGS